MDKNGTVEIYHNNILEKIEHVKVIFQVYRQYNIEKCVNFMTNKKVQRMEKTITGVHDAYTLSTISPIASYYTHKKNINNHRNISNPNNNYNMNMIEDNYNGKLDECLYFFTRLSEYLSSSGGHNKKMVSVLNESIRSSRSSGITLSVEKVKYDTCDCGTKMKIFPISSELRCPSCGKVDILYGTVFEDAQFFNQEGQRSKHGNYEPSRHCRFWVSRIQAKGSIEIPETCTEHILECVRRDGIRDKRRLTCAQIRNYLKETKFTDYNDHVPSIRKIIAGVVPPQLTHEELRKLYNLFDKAVHVYDIVKPVNKSNRMYYPYIIYKILEQLLKDGRRKKQILECIHLQSRDTLIANDNTWELVCKDINGLAYKPTDKNEQLIHW
jgi:hypothetical protein